MTIKGGNNMKKRSLLIVLLSVFLLLPLSGKTVKADSWGEMTSEGDIYWGDEIPEGAKAYAVKIENGPRTLKEDILPPTANSYYTWWNLYQLYEKGEIEVGQRLYLSVRSCSNVPANYDACDYIDPYGDDYHYDFDLSYHRVLTDVNIKEAGSVYVYSPMPYNFPSNADNRFPRHSIVAIQAIPAAGYRLNYFYDPDFHTKFDHITNDEFGIRLEMDRMIIAYFEKIPAPPVVTVYNATEGADIRFKAPSGYEGEQYLILRKENGNWSVVTTVYLTDLVKEGGNYKYIDTAVKENYGKGYIYSVALMDKKENWIYDSKGIPFYRLRKPEITSAVKQSSTSALVTWPKMSDAQGYELQYSTDGGSTWKTAGLTSDNKKTVTGLPGSGNVYFRLRSYKENPSRGKVFSAYSPWKKLTTLQYKAPKLVAIYNSANGADVRWQPLDGFEEYVLMRKENGIWSQVTTLKASSLTKENGNYKYIDQTVKERYGKGYIYSVAVKDKNGVLYYDKLGLAFYRLKAPTIRSITANGSGKVTVTWSDEVCQGYELQTSTDNGAHWGILSKTTATSEELYDLMPGIKYTFRVRCQKTNGDRGTVWSPYSAWKSVTVK